MHRGGDIVNLLNWRALVVAGVTFVVFVARWNKKKEKWHRIEAAGLFIIALVSLLFAVEPLFSPNGSDESVHEDEIIIALEKGNHDEAIALAMNTNSDALRIRLEDRLDIVTTDFLNDSIQFYAVTEELYTIERMNITGLSSAVNRTRTFINNLNDSRTAYLTAETMFEYGEYASAIVQYRLVISADPNYYSALDGIIRATDAFRNVTLILASEYSDDGDYSSAVRILTDALGIIENDSELTHRLNAYTDSLANEINQRWTLNRFPELSTVPIRYHYYQDYDIILNAPNGTQITVDGYHVNTHGNVWYRTSYVPRLGNGVFWIYSGNLTATSPE